MVAILVTLSCKPENNCGAGTDSDFAHRTSAHTSAVRARNEEKMEWVMREGRLGKNFNKENTGK